MYVVPLLSEQVTQSYLEYVQDEADPVPPQTPTSAQVILSEAVSARVVADV